MSNTATRKWSDQELVSTVRVLGTHRRRQLTPERAVLVDGVKTAAERLTTDQLDRLYRYAFRILRRQPATAGPRAAREN